MASIVEVKNKNGISYKITVSNGIDIRGKKITKSTTFRPDPNQTSKQQEKTLNKFAFEFEEKVKNSKCLNAERLFFEGFLHEWLDDVKIRVTSNTYESYRMHSNNHIIPFFKNYRLGEIDTRLVEKFYASMIDSYSHATIIKIKNILNGMFKKAICWNLTEINPCANATIPKSKKKSEGIKFFTQTQAVSFLRSLDIAFETTYKGHQRIDDTGKPYIVREYIESRNVPLQLKMFFNIALCCGLRRNELLALHWSDIDFEQRTIKITKSLEKSKNGIAFKEPKTKSSIRTVVIPTEIMPLIKQYRNEYNKIKFASGSAWKGHNNIFIQTDGKLMGITTPYQHFKNHIKKFNKWIEQNKVQAQLQGLEALPNIPLHGLRHSCASILNYLGVNYSEISKILGHANIGTTMNIYMHSFDECNRVASDKLNNFLVANS
ncbi:MAG: site-specific integrase [Defluviitaleaceae bacterium]|nr:site-specific integrase [Defluviitaleaceae bacterium]